jgi:hypothetical protein
MVRAPVVLLVAGLVAGTPVVVLAAAPPWDLKAADVCAIVPGADVARSTGGALVQAKRFNAPDGTLARCVYLVGPSGGKETGAWVVEVHPAAVFGELRPYVEAPVRDVPGIGDGAWEYKDADSGRWWLYTHRRGEATVLVTGADDALVRKLAALALARL